MNEFIILTIVVVTIVVAVGIQLLPDRWFHGKIFDWIARRL